MFALIAVSLIILIVRSAAAQNWLYTGLSAVAFIGAVIVAVDRFVFSRQSSGKLDRKRLILEALEPDIQRQTLQVEVDELSKVLEIEAEHISDLQTAFIVAEDLALRQVQRDENVALMRHVTIGKSPFGAVMIKGETVVCIDVSFLVAPDVRSEKVDAILRKIEAAKKTFAESGITVKVQLMIVLVTQLTPEDDDRLRAEIKSKFKAAPVGVTIVISILDFESLQKIYVTE